MYVTSTQTCNFCKLIYNIGMYKNHTPSDFKKYFGLPEDYKVDGVFTYGSWRKKEHKELLKQIIKELGYNVEYEKFVWVDFDNKFEGGHNCFNGTAKHGHGFFLPPEDLEFVNKILTIKQWKKK